MIITPKDQVAPKSTGEPLEISKTKMTAMVKKATELLTKPMSTDKLAHEIEQYYVFEKNEHYTSAQIKDIVMQVAADLAPVKEVEVTE